MTSDLKTSGNMSYSTEFSMRQGCDVLDRIKTVAVAVAMTHAELTAAKDVLAEIEARPDVTDARLLAARTFVKIHQTTYDTMKKIVADM
jgi:hypothetical protein